MRSGNVLFAQASINTNPSTLLKLLLVRVLCDVDPAPEFPASPPLPAAVRDRYPRIVQDDGHTWRLHWKAAMSELAPVAPPASGSWTTWPSELPRPTSDDVSAWGVSIHRPSRGTPLDQHPSRRYYLARVAAPHVLPERVVVLPFVGRYTGLLNDDVGYLSAETFLHPRDALYGFQGA